MEYLKKFMLPEGTGDSNFTRELHHCTSMGVSYTFAYSGLFMAISHDHSIQGYGFHSDLLNMINEYTAVLGMDCVVYTIDPAKLTQYLEQTEGTTEGLVRPYYGRSTCTSCSGTGNFDRSVTCPGCQGSSSNGETECTMCGGVGYLPQGSTLYMQPGFMEADKEPCNTCTGSGSRFNWEESLTFPAGLGLPQYVVEIMGAHYEDIKVFVPKAARRSYDGGDQYVAYMPQNYIVRLRNQHHGVDLYVNAGKFVRRRSDSGANCEYSSCSGVTTPEAEGLAYRGRSDRSDDGVQLDS